MDIDYEKLEDEITTGYFKQRLKEELINGFRQIQVEGERLPPASYFATKVAEVVNNGSPEPLGGDLAYYLYQEILSAAEEARAEVLGEEKKPS